MVRIEEEREKIRRAKEIIRTTKSPYLKRDMQKYVRKAERQVKQALLFMREGKTCPEASTPTASRI